MREVCSNVMLMPQRLARRKIAIQSVLGIAMPVLPEAALSAWLRRDRCRAPILPRRRGAVPPTFPRAVRRTVTLSPADRRIRGLRQPRPHCSSPWLELHRPRARSERQAKRQRHEPDSACADFHRANPVPCVRRPSTDRKKGGSAARVLCNLDLALDSQCETCAHSSVATDDWERCASTRVWSARREAFKTLQRLPHRQTCRCVCGSSLWLTRRPRSGATQGDPPGYAIQQ